MRLLDKKRERMEMERERLAEINNQPTMEWRARRNTVQLRAKLKAGKKKKRQRQLDTEVSITAAAASENTRQFRVDIQAVGISTA